ncbi:MAG TPA: HK97-gp10 family putative phage morphogenesis protein [Anaerolineae bacterium]|nr:HK97-gp10 family putative phage morphogenesis protein [Anaerolineae bacterium]
MSKVVFKDWEQGKQRVLAAVSGRLVQNMDKACEYAEGQAQANAPVWRGVLKSDITHTVTVKANIIQGVIGVKKKAYWGWFQEVGTAHHAAHPFLRPAVFGNAQEILRLLRGG